MVIYMCQIIFFFFSVSLKIKWLIFALSFVKVPFHQTSNTVGIKEYKYINRQLLRTGDTITNKSHKIEGSKQPMKIRILVGDAVRGIVPMQTFYFHICWSHHSADKRSCWQPLLKVKFQAKESIATHDRYIPVHSNALQNEEITLVVMSNSMPTSVICHSSLNFLIKCPCVKSSKWRWQDISKILKLSVSSFTIKFYIRNNCHVLNT